VQGKILMEKEIDYFDGSLELDMLSWANGLYLLQINAAAGKSFHKINLLR